MQVEIIPHATIKIPYEKLAYATPAIKGGYVPYYMTEPISLEILSHVYLHDYKALSIDDIANSSQYNIVCHNEDFFNSLVYLTEKITLEDGFYVVKFPTLSTMELVKFAGGYNRMFEDGEDIVKHTTITSYATLDIFVREITGIDTPHVLYSAPEILQPYMEISCVFNSNHTATVMGICESVGAVYDNHGIIRTTTNARYILNSLTLMGVLFLSIMIYLDDEYPTSEVDLKVRRML